MALDQIQYQSYGSAKENVATRARLVQTTYDYTGLHMGFGY